MEESKYSEIRTLILKTAGNIFTRFGFRKTTVEDIAGALNKVKSSIYYYFKNKEDIFKNIVEEERIVMNIELAKILEGKDEPEKKLKTYLMTRFKLLIHMVNYYNALKDRYLENYPFINNIRKINYMDEIKAIKSILKEGVKRGIYSAVNIRQTAITILLASKVLEDRAVIDRKIDNIENDLDSLLRLLFHGILKHEF